MGVEYVQEMSDFLLVTVVLTVDENNENTFPHPPFSLPDHSLFLTTFHAGSVRASPLCMLTMIARLHCSLMWRGVLEMPLRPTLVPNS